jgi:ferredoxin
MKLSIDPNLCMAHGRCYSLAPDLIEMNDEGYPAATEPIDVPAGSEQLADEVQGSCPEGAITLLAD